MTGGDVTLLVGGRDRHGEVVPADQTGDAAPIGGGHAHVRNAGVGLHVGCVVVRPVGGLPGYHDDAGQTVLRGRDSCRWTRP